MFAYVDETGHTGSNLFDPAQSRFLTAALLARTDFQLSHGRRLRQALAEHGLVALHASKLGPATVESLAPHLNALLDSPDVRFAFVLVDKPYLATSKMFDTLFDAGENLSVPWHTYWMRPLRLALLLKIAAVLDEATVASFWDGMIEPDPGRCRKLIMASLQSLSARFAAISDTRARSLAIEAVQWAIGNPEAITFHVEGKIARRGHMPNMAAFSALLDAMDSCATRWSSPVKQIVHDRQSEFESTMKEWHEIAATASAAPMRVPGGDAYTFRKVPGSQLLFVPSGESAGIQCVDVALWLFRRVHSGNALGPSSQELLGTIAGKADIRELSFQAVEAELETTFAALGALPISEPELRKAKALLEQEETRRKQNMLEYARRKVTP